MSAAPFSAKALALIIASEGLDQPGKWPGGASGVTIGFGYDLGYVNAALFANDWKARLEPAIFLRLQRAIGVRGTKAKIAARLLNDITVSTEDARAVLLTASIPSYVAEARADFPGIADLPLDAQGALVSLVYNRGPSLVGSSRIEMERIHELLADGVQAGDLAAIAKQVRQMKRLWIGKGLAGLITRREAEAVLIESST